MGATLDDNPHLDREAYKEALSELTALEQEQLLHGNWEAREAGGLFDRKNFIPLPRHEFPPECKYVRFWDIASTDPNKAKAGKKRAKVDPDSTVGTLIGFFRKNYYIADIKAIQGSPAQVDDLIASTAEADGKRVKVRMEKQPGAAGEFVHEHFKFLLAGFDFDSVAASGSKEERARPLAVASENGRVYYNPNLAHIGEFFGQAEVFPYGSHDDFVDSASGGTSFFKQNGSVSTIKPIARKDSYWKRV